MDTPNENLNFFKSLVRQNDKTLDTHRRANFNASRNHLKFKFQQAVTFKYSLIVGKPSLPAFHAYAQAAKYLNLTILKRSQGKSHI